MSKRQTKSSEPAGSTDVTGLLNAWTGGDLFARDKAMGAVYLQLKRRAAARLRRERTKTLSPTEVVHEVYLRLARQRMTWDNRAQFFGVASQMMRRVLVDHARARLAGKRAALRVEWTDDLAMVPERDVELLELDEALTELAEADPRQGRLVELRFFGGLSLEESADALSVSLSTANRDWRFARAWLFRRLSTSSPATNDTR